MRKLLHVRFHARDVQRLSVLGLIHGSAEQYVIFQRQRLHPRDLCHVGNRTADVGRATDTRRAVRSVALVHVAEERGDQSRLPATHCAHHHGELASAKLEVDVLQEGLLGGTGRGPVEVSSRDGRYECIRLGHGLATLALNRGPSPGGPRAHRRAHVGELNLSRLDPTDGPAQVRTHAHVLVVVVVVLHTSPIYRARAFRSVNVRRKLHRRRRRLWE